MDWQGLTAGLVVGLAVVFLVVSYVRRRNKSGACAECVVHHKVMSARKPDQALRRD